MKININIIIGGILSGLAVGGLVDIITGYSFFWIIFVIFGVQTGIILAQREKLKELKKKKGGKR